MRFERVPCGSRYARQKENFNDRKVAARPVDYGFAGIRPSDDFEGADFIALHVDGDAMSKGRMTFDRKYVGKGLHVAFPLGERVFVYPRDEVPDDVARRQAFSSNRAWLDDGLVHWGSSPAWALAALEPWGT